MVADSRHREKTSESRENIWNPQKYCESKRNYKIEKKITESKKIFQNQEKNFRIEKNISELRKLFQNREIFCYKNREKIFDIKCFYNIFA